MATLRPDQIVTDPLTTLSTPSAVEAALASRLGRDPFAMGHFVGAQFRREAGARDLAAQQGQANALRSVLAQRIMQNDRTTEALKNIQNVQPVVGSVGAAQAAGLQPTGFSVARDPVDFAQIQADAQQTASEAALSGAQAGATPVQSDAFSQVTGFGIQPNVPLGVQEEQAGAALPKAIFFGADGIQFQVPIDPSQVPATFRQRINDQATGASNAETQPQDAAQADAVEQIKRNAAINNWQLVAPPRGVRLSNGQPAVEYEYSTPEGNRKFYAVQGSPTPVGTQPNGNE